LFFAISGFVIARSLLPTLAAVRNSAEFLRVAGAFWRRRIWRLLPSAWLWLGIILAASAFFNRTGLFGSVRTNAWATMAGVFDFANFRFADAFFRYPYGASFAWWSLSLEEQFYLVLPPVAYLFGRFLPVLLLPLVVYQFQMQRTLLLMVLRTDAIMMGVLLACWAQTPFLKWASDRMAQLPRWLKFLTTCGILLALVTRSHDVMPYSVGLIALFSAGLVLLASLDCGYILGASHLRPLAAWIGARSYALYLIHIPAFFFARELWFRWGASDNEYAVCFTAILILFGGAELNWRLIEQPVRRHFLQRPHGDWLTARKPAQIFNTTGH
jgi:peptidoglycan/LPS O-acetylase OafA/YrhL